MVGGRPYKNNDSMEMIRHHDMGIGLNTGIICRNFVKDYFYHLPGVIQFHFAIVNVSEQA